MTRIARAKCRIVGCPRRMTVQMPMRARKRQGRRCEVMNKKQVVTKRIRKILELRDSLLKFVDGVIPAMSASCAVEKSSMLF